MSRPRKDGKNVNYYIDRVVYERLCRYADQKGQTVTRAIERLLTSAMDQEGFETAGQEGADDDEE